MVRKQIELQALTERFDALSQSLARGQSVSETELVNVARKLYSYIKVSPVSSLTRKALVLLTTAPSHPELDPWRLKASGAEDMYARLISTRLSPNIREQDRTYSSGALEEHKSLEESYQMEPDETPPASESDEAPSQSGLTSPDDVEF
jgi:hypothetical protein